MPEAGFEKLRRQVLATKGMDFAQYSRDYVKRRVAIRLQALNLPADAFGAYADLLASRPAEYTELFNAFSVNVTEFFRDLFPWQTLREKLLPAVARAKLAAGQQTLRVWSCACSSGEEPYSIAILLAETLPKAAPGLRWTITATDIDQDALDSARAGAYCGYSLRNVGLMEQAWPAKYFTEIHDGFPCPAPTKDTDTRRYRLADAVRRAVGFRRHNFLADAAPAGVDLVFCRNVIIYLNRESKQALIEKFRASLVPNGLLVLGLSELILAGGDSKGFQSVEPKDHIYRKLPPGA